jgi:hypothetical protein
MGRHDFIQDWNQQENGGRANMTSDGFFYGIQIKKDADIYVLQNKASLSFSSLGDPRVIIPIQHSFTFKIVSSLLSSSNSRTHHVVVYLYHR